VVALGAAACPIVAAVLLPIARSKSGAWAAAALFYLFIASIGILALSATGASTLITALAALSVVMTTAALSAACLTRATDEPPTLRDERESAALTLQLLVSRGRRWRDFERAFWAYVDERPR
jgi:hypothetical protein